MPAIWNEPKIECIEMEHTFQFGAHSYECVYSSIMQQLP